MLSRSDHASESLKDSNDFSTRLPVALEVFPRRRRWPTAAHQLPDDCGASCERCRTTSRTPACASSTPDRRRIGSARQILTLSRRGVALACHTRRSTVRRASRLLRSPPSCSAVSDDDSDQRRGFRRGERIDQPPRLAQHLGIAPGVAQRKHHGRAKLWTSLRIRPAFGVQPETMRRAAAAVSLHPALERRAQRLIHEPVRDVVDAIAARSAIAGLELALHELTRQATDSPRCSVRRAGRAPRDLREASSARPA